MTSSGYQARTLIHGAKISIYCFTDVHLWKISQEVVADMAMNMICSNYTAIKEPNLTQFTMQYK